MKEADTVKLLTFPTSAASFRAWRIATRNEIHAASGRPGPRMFAWILEVENFDVSFEALAEPGKHKTLDAKILAAILKVQSGGLGSRILMASDTAAVTRKRPLSGRQALRMIYQEFKVDDEAGTHYIEDLMAVRLVDDKYESFLTLWDMVVDNMVEPLPERTLRAFFLKQVRGKAAFQHDIAYFERLESGHVDKNYAFLRRRVQALIERNRQEKNRQGQRAAISGGNPIATPAAKGKAKAKPKAKAETGAAKAAPAPPPKAKAKAGSDTARAGGTTGNKGECFKWLEGSCASGKDCPYAHTPGKKGLQAERLGQEQGVPLLQGEPLQVR